MISLSLCAILLGWTPAVGQPAGSLEGNVVVSHAVSQVAPPAISSPTSSQADPAAKDGDYLRREAASGDLEEFAGGAVVIIGVGIVVVVLVVVLLLLVIRW